MIKVLLVEDNPGDVRLIQEMLKDTDKVSLRLDHAESLTQGMEVLQKEDIDLVLLDLGLPESQGLDTLSTFLSRIPEIPVVVLTGLDQEETGTQAVRNGAQDYLIKGELDGPLLFRSINYAIERNRAERQINYLNSLLRSVRAVNQVIAQEPDLSTILKKSCESLVDTRGYVDVSIAVRDDESDLLFPAAHAGNYLRETWGVTPEGEGEAPKCIQEVFKTRRPLIIHSTAEYCGDCNYCTHTATHQSVVVPCFHKGEILGVLTICKEKDFPLSDEETSLLEEIAGDLALAQAHKRAERNLQKSEIEFRALFNSANDAVFFHDLEGNILEVNRTACERLGYSHDELLKMRIPDLDAPDYAHLFGEKVRELEKKGDMVFETAHVRHDGKAIAVEAGSRVVEYKKGKAILTVARDITERKQAEESLKERVKELDCLYSVTRDTQKGLSIDEVCRRSVEHLIQGMHFPEITAVVIEINGKRFTSGNYTEDLSHGLRAEITVKGKAYGRLWVYYTEERSFLIPEEQDLVDGIAETLSIWLERKQAEEILKESEERYRLLADNTIDCIWTMNMDLVFTYINPAIYGMTGFTPEEWIGSRLQDHCDRENFEKMGQAVIRAVQKLPDNKGIDFEAVMLKKNGDPVSVEINGKVLVDETGQPVGLQGITRDITERKQAEADHEKLQSQLIQAQKMESVGRLAGGVAHDFNNQLTVMMGNAQLAMQDLDEADPLYNDLQEILDAGESAVGIVRKLLAFARKQTISPKVLNLNETVDSMLKMLRRLIGEDLDLTWEPGKDLWPVNMDPSQIDQILANLCVNAKDAMDTGGKITIETQNMTLDAAYCQDHAGFVPGEYVMLAVSDNGKGMDKETLANVFEPFYTTKRVGKGTGLGLSTVYGIVKQNNGFINAYSEPGQGTTFKIYLPRHRGDVQADGEAVQSQLPTGQGETIVIVEDEPTVLKVAQRTLERLGYQIMTFENPVEAVTWAEGCHEDIHLLMTDVIMPDMSGKALAEAIQKIQPNTRTLYMSGYTANAIAHQGVLDKGVHFIQKPFGPEGLARKVRDVLE